MRVSIIITTLNRADSLADTLHSFQYQTYRDFEVIVVAGPCKDHTDRVLDNFRHAIRLLRHDRANVNEQRNLGIAISAGEIVAFIDDDAVPHPCWLEQLVAGYDSPQVGAVGGVVFDYTGYRIQFSRAVCDRLGNNYNLDSTSIEPADSKRFNHLMGTNLSARRDYIAQVGGFDEEIEYYLDETELCLQIIERGFEIRSLPNAAVYHRFLPSQLRCSPAVITRPYPLVKNKLYFALSHGRDLGISTILQDITQFIEKLNAGSRKNHEMRKLDEKGLTLFQNEVDRGLMEGMQQGVKRQRKSTQLPAIDPTVFKPYPTLRPSGPRTRLLIAEPGVSAETLIARVESLAQIGHECHVFVPTDGHPRVDYERGIWVHRLPHLSRWVPELRDQASEPTITWAAICYLEWQRMIQLGPIELIEVLGDSKLRGLFLSPEMENRWISWLTGEMSLSVSQAEAALKWLLDPTAADGSIHRSMILFESLKYEPATMIENAYRLIHDREPRPDETAHWLRLLGEGRSRFEILSELSAVDLEKPPVWYRLFATLERESTPKVQPAMAFVRMVCRKGRSAVRRGRNALKRLLNPMRNLMPRL